MKKKISILGSTGSIGKNTVEIIGDRLERYEVDVLFANSNVDLLAKQAIMLNANHVIIGEEDKYSKLCELLSGRDLKISYGVDSILECEFEKDVIVVIAIVGIAGIKPTMHVAKTGAKLAIANKESIICAGSLLKEEAEKSSSKIIPIDSEHSGIFQLIEKTNYELLDKVIITASGGPFLNYKYEDLEYITPKEAIKHPNWSMGVKNSIDSATMVNKGIELIEAHFLFDLEADKLDAIIHPQSIIHAIAEYKDGSYTAQFSIPDMQIPISYAIDYPSRMNLNKKLDFTQIKNLNFIEIDHLKFPAIKLAKDVIKIGNGSNIVFNTANEIAVEAFVKNQIKFTDINNVIYYALSRVKANNPSSLEEILDIDRRTREFCRNHINQIRLFINVA